MGTRCRSGRRPGGSVIAIRGQGSQADLSLPPCCNGVSHSRQCNEAHIISLGFREDESDGTGIGEGRGNSHHA
jgi:hypothetical protein